MKSCHVKGTEKLHVAEEIGVAGGVWRDMAEKATWLSEWS